MKGDKRIQRHGQSPWGTILFVQKLADGVHFVTTEKHGGIHVQRRLMDKIPQEYRAYAKRWSGSSQWFEEDCCAAIPAHFLVDAKQHSLASVERYIREQQ